MHRDKVMDKAKSSTGQPKETSASEATARKGTRRFFVPLLFLLVVLAIVEGVSFIGLRVAASFLGTEVVSRHEHYEGIRNAVQLMQEQRPTARAAFDAHLGWRPRAGSDNGVDLINSQGLRSARDYAAEPAQGDIRIAVFGNSFVYGSEVLGHEAWPALLEQRLDGVEVLNYGVPGYGPDQALLRFRAEGRELGPDIVILGLATPSLLRAVTISPGFRSTSPHFLSKPRFVLGEEGELVLLPNPVRSIEEARRYADHPAAIRELGEFDYWYEPLVFENPVYDYSYTVRLAVTVWSKLWRRYLDDDRPLTGSPGHGIFNDSSMAFQILTVIIDEFVEQAEAWGMRPLIAILPDGYSVLRSLEREPGVMDLVREYCTLRKIPVVDLTDAFLAEPGSTEPKTWFNNLFHYSSLGNDVVARWFEQELEGGRWARSDQRHSRQQSTEPVL